MRVLRCAVYPNPTDPPVMTVARDCDLTDTIESAQHRLITPGVFVAFDVYEMPDGTDIKEATFEAGRRTTAEMHLREFNQALSYHWNGAALRRVREGGILMNDKPAPLSAEECATVLTQLAQHPNRKPNVTIVQIAHDGKPV